MLESSNFGHITTSTIFESLDKSFADHIIVENYDVIVFISKYLFLRNAGVNNFAEVIKIFVIFVKKILKESRKVEIIRSYVTKYNLCLYFLRKIC